MIARDTDRTNDWHEAADAAPETRTYYVHNWRGDVVSVHASSGDVTEQYRYTAYGVPIRLSIGDADGDGYSGTGDLIVYLTDFGTSTNPASDFNRDGITDTADNTLLNEYWGASHADGYGELARGDGDTYAHSGGRKGYASYEHTFFDESTMHVRHRVYDAELGRWTRRDPAGYVDGKNVYGYARMGPISGIDPTGLVVQGRRCFLCAGTKEVCDRLNAGCDSSRPWIVGDWLPGITVTSPDLSLDRFVPSYPTHGGTGQTPWWEAYVDESCQFNPAEALPGAGNNLYCKQLSECMIPSETGLRPDCMARARAAVVQACSYYGSHESDMPLGPEQESARQSIINSAINAINSCHHQTDFWGEAFATCVRDSVGALGDDSCGNGCSQAARRALVDALLQAMADKSKAKGPVAMGWCMLDCWAGHKGGATQDETALCLTQCLGTMLPVPPGAECLTCLLGAVGGCVLEGLGI